MKRLLFLLLLLASPLWATTYYISPTGSDGNTGVSTGSPFKTFAHAIPLLFAGDNLFLLNGTYSSATGTGYPNINCSTTAHNSTSGSPITIQALNERQAFISGNGGEESFEMQHCSYWNIVGLHIEGADNSGTGNTFTGDVVFLFTDNHITFRRNIIARSNRFGNVHNFVASALTNSLIEENECYYNYRHCFLLYNDSNNNEIRRNYANARGYFNGPTGDYCSNCLDTAGMMNYGSQNNTWEDNITEGEPIGHNNEPISGGTIAANNTFYHSISLNDNSCFRSDAHIAGFASNSQNIRWTQSVCVHPRDNGLWSRSSTGTVGTNISVFSTSTTISGVAVDQDSSEGGLPFTFTGTNIAVTRSVTGGTAFLQASGATASADHVNSFQNSTLAGGGFTLTNVTTVNPGFGSCFLWVPDGSPLKGSGASGADKGATILYQYIGGTLTSNKLWDSTTGAPLFVGATVAGLNDVAGSSLFDIANRLNSSKNGCSFPSAYAGASSPLNPPTGLTATVN